jgi:hypothetical protein
MAAAGAATSITAAIQSSLSFCKAQTKIADLRLDKVLVSGGGARLRGLRGLLREALRCPVELFDPFANLDLAALPAADAEQLQAMRHEAVIALGLAVGRCDDTLYSLEILPESVRRRQRFQQRTIWNIAAGALLVGLLGLQSYIGKEAYAAAETQASVVKRQIASKQQVHNDAEAKIAANKQERVLVEHLRTQALPFHGLLRIQRALAQHLPPQLWIEKIELAGGSTVGAQKHPSVKIAVAGKALNGVEPDRIFIAFFTKFRTDPLMAPLAAKADKDPERITMNPLSSPDSNKRNEITVELVEGK